MRILLVGAAFARSYLPAVLAHPQVAVVGLCDPDADRLASVGAAFGVTARRRHADLDRALAAGGYDAAMILTPIPFHAQQSIAVLSAGLHCACTVPMAATEAECSQVAAARRAYGRCYFMMETSCFTPEFQQVRHMVDAGEMGDLQFLRGVWFNHLDQHPRWWHGLPPMHYITHPLGPLLMLAGRRVADVAAFGSGRLPEGFSGGYGNPFPVETAVFALGAEPLSPRCGPHPHAAGPLAIEITSIVSATAVQCRESFDVYGSRQSFVWSSMQGDGHALVRRLVTEPRRRDKSNPIATMRFQTPGVALDLPPALAALPGWTVPACVVHEFVSACQEGRPSSIDVEEATAMTVPGLRAHACAMRAARAA